MERGGIDMSETGEVGSIGLGNAKDSTWSVDSRFPLCCGMATYNHKISTEGLFFEWYKSGGRYAAAEDKKQFDERSFPRVGVRELVS